jgi:hypothetical protein
MLLKKFKLLNLAFLVFVIIMPQPAYAQSCNTPFEVIITLRLPRFGVPSVWDATFGKEQRIVKFSSAVPQDDGTVLVAGEMLSVEDYRTEKNFLVKLNRRGRALMETYHEARLNEASVDMITVGADYLVASNFSGSKTDEWVRLLWYDSNGQKKREKIIKDDAYNFRVKDLENSVMGDGFTVLLHATNKAAPEDIYGLLISFTDSGEELWRRAYRPGIPNTLFNISAVPLRDHYLASGEILMDDGRIAGWVLELNHDGTVVWQRTYPRGASSSLSSGSMYGKNYIFTGYASPLDDGHRAAWLLVLSNLGEPLWQRYYRGREHDFSGAGVLVHDDLRVSLLLNARAIEGSLQNTHTRILTLTQQGEVVQDEPYISGISTSARAFYMGPRQERVMVANILTDPDPDVADKGIEAIFFGDESEDQVAYESAQTSKKPDHQGWVMIATPLDPYKDPCDE